MPEPIAASSPAVPASDPAELVTVWEECRAELRRLVAALGIASTSLDDVLQDVYLAALQTAPPATEREGLRRWLFRVTVNRANLEHRRRGRWKSAFQRLARSFRGFGQAANPARIASEADQRAVVRQALDRLDPQERNVLVLRYYAELNSREIATILELPDSTVRSRLRLARQKLAEALRQAGYRHDEL